NRIIVDTAPIAAQDLPVGVTATFDGYTVDGKNKSSDLYEGVISDALARLVESREKPSGNEYGGRYTDKESQDLATALRTGDTSKVSSLVKFEELQLTVKGQAVTAKVPVAQGYMPWESMISNERERRLSLLSNKIVRLLKSTGKD